MHRFILIAVLLAAGCDTTSSQPERASAAPAATPTPAPAVTGQVTCDGQPVAGAFLVVTDVADGLVPAGLDPRDLFTGDDGRFRLELAPGSYAVIAVGPKGWRAQADLSVDGPATLDLALAEDRQRIIDFMTNGPTERSEESE